MPEIQIPDFQTGRYWRFPEKTRASPEKEAEASQINLLLIRFHLGKVRVYSQIQGQT